MIYLIFEQTEGHEYDCLIGLFEGIKHCDVKYIQIENHNHDMYVNHTPIEKTLKLLNENSFEILKIIISDAGYSNFENNGELQ